MRIKSFDELTIQDNFIFQKVMIKKPICKVASDDLLRDIESAVDEAKHCEAWREEYSMLSMDHYIYWKEGVAEGRAEGLTEGKAQGKAEVVLQMLRENVSPELIAKFTNFTVEEVTAIAKEHALM